MGAYLNTHIMSLLLTKMSIIVIGAGTAGVSTVGALVQQGFSNILWFDPQFQGGSMKQYDGVPSNTKAKNLSKYAKHLTLFDKYNTKQTTVDVFEELEPEKQTTLNKLKECLDRMTKILQNDFKDKVTLIRGSMTKVTQLQDLTFQVQTDSTKCPVAKGRLLFLCLGALLKPVKTRPDLQRVSAFDIMSVKKIQKYNFTEDVIEVHGSSHSAVLCLRNLTLMNNPPKKIYHIMNKKSLLHAEYVGNFIRHDTIGLKGLASQFGKQYENGKYQNYIQTQFTWDAKSNDDSTKIIEAIGFQPQGFQFCSKEGITDYETKQGFVYVKEEKIPNLHLIGILSPQYFTDKEGQRMPAVGVDKFLCYVLSILNPIRNTEPTQCLAQCG